MKLTLHFLLFLFLFTTIACNENSSDTTGEIIELDVSKSYPEKEINLSDLASIEYVVLETDDDYLFRGDIRCFTEKVILIHDGTEDTFLFFSRDGKTKSKFNHKGNGPGEYSYVFGVAYDEKQDELYVSTIEKILVYSSAGDFKRELPLPKETWINNIKIFDEETLLIHDGYKKYPTPFVLISKEDASVVREIPVPTGDDIALNVRRQDGESVMIYSMRTHQIVPHQNGFLLTEYSIDTVFLYKKDYTLTPVLVRHPSIQSMSPVIYLNAFLEAGDYNFMQSIAVVFDWDTRRGFDSEHYMHEKKSGNIYRQKVVFDEYKRRGFFITPELLERSVDHKTGYQWLRVEELQAAYEEGRLSGRLKEIAANLDDEDNNVIMFFHFK